MATKAKCFDTLLAGLVDSSGNRLGSGYIKFYDVGTSTLKVVYEDRDKVTSAGSTVTLDSTGGLLYDTPIFLDGLYKIEIYDSADVLLLTLDGVGQGISEDAWVEASAYASLNAAITDIGSTETDLLIDSQISMTAGATIPITMRLIIPSGGSIDQSTYTLTFAAGTSPPQAGNYRIFDGTGTISGLSYVNPIWFGVVQDWNGTTGTDNATTLAAAFNAVAAGGKLEFPPVINKGISFSSNVAFDSHLAILEGNHNVFKYTGAGTAMNIAGDAQVIKNLTLIGNATPGDIGFYHPNGNTGIIENVHVFGGFTTAWKMSGPNHGVIIHSGVDYNQSVTANDILTVATWGGNVTTGFWLFALGGQNPEGVMFLNCQVQNSTKTGTGWDVDAGVNITIMNSVFQNLTTGIDIGAAARVALINPWFETGTVDTEIVDASEATWTATGLGLRIHNTTLLNRNFGSGNTFGALGTSPAANAPVIYFYDDQGTRATGVSIRGDSKDGAGVYGVQTAPSGSVVAGEAWGGVVGKAASTATVGIGVRGQGAEDVTSYAGYFEDGMLYTESWNPKYRTVTVDTTLGAASDFLIYVNAAGKTMTLPTAAAGNGQIITIKLIAAATTATVDGNAAETIDGAATYTLSAQYKYVTVQSNGSAWFIIANN